MKIILSYVSRTDVGSFHEVLYHLKVKKESYILGSGDTLIEDGLKKEDVVLTLGNIVRLDAPQVNYSVNPRLWGYPLGYNGTQDSGYEATMLTNLVTSMQNKVIFTCII